MLGTFIVAASGFLTLVLLWTAYSVVADSGHAPRAVARTGVRWRLVLAVVAAYVVFQVIVVIPALNLMGVIE